METIKSVILVKDDLRWQDMRITARLIANAWLILSGHLTPAALYYDKNLYYITS